MQNVPVAHFEWRIAVLSTAAIGALSASGGRTGELNSFELLKNSNLSPFRLTIYKKWYKTYKITKTKELLINNFTM